MSLRKKEGMKWWWNGLLLDLVVVVRVRLEKEIVGLGLWKWEWNVRMGCRLVWVLKMYGLYSGFLCSFDFVWID